MTHMVCKQCSIEYAPSLRLASKAASLFRTLPAFCRAATDWRLWMSSCRRRIVARAKAVPT